MSQSKMQDMPPAGGYKSIPFKKIPARSYISGPQIFGGFFAITAVAAYIFYKQEQMLHREEVEERSAQCAIMPFLMAERDRAYLKELRRNRDEESRLMANVPGWKTGTLYGEPVYFTQPKDALIDPELREFYVHTEFKHLAKRAYLQLWN